jgi:phosphatidylglycerophosphate synthase
VDRLVILSPALAGVAFMAIMFGVYCVLCATGRTPVIEGLDRRRFTELFGPFMTRYILWLIRPIERVLLAAKISPNTLTCMALAGCALAGCAIATGHLATATWAYVLAGICDILDGRLARASGKQSIAGALFDSVADRWGEIFVFTGCAWYLHDSLWLLTVMGAFGGSIMVSYTRARGEGLGLRLDGGTMQRAERIVLVSLGTLVAAWLEAAPSSDDWGEPALGVALTAVGVFSAITALGRWLRGYRELVALEAGVPLTPIVPLRPRDPQPAKMRITGEHTA